MLRYSLEAAELFGEPRKVLLSRLRDPGVVGRKFRWVDWDEYVGVMRPVFERIGSGPALVPMGQRYLNERYRTRSAHLYAQYRNWERMLWVAKTLMAGRMMRGYEIDYTPLGDDRFEVTMSIPEHLEGFPDFFYFLTGVWTGSSPQAKLQHTIHSLEVFPHRAVADITFDRRSLHSRVAYNPLYSRLKSFWELWCCRREAQRIASDLTRETENLDKAFDAVSDLVFLIREGEVIQANREGRALLDGAGFSMESFAGIFREDGGPTVSVWEGLDRVYRVRCSSWLDARGRREHLLTLQDQTRLLALEQRAKTGALEARRLAEKRLEEDLGSLLAELDLQLAEATNGEEDPETRELLTSLGALARHCREQGLALVEDTMIGFPTDAELMQALNQLAREYREVFGFEVRLEGASFPRLEEARDRGELFLILREAVRNAWRHSGTDEVRVCVSPIEVRVVDAGRGFGAKDQNGSGLGMDSIRERAEKIGLEAVQMQSEGAGAGWVFKPRMCGELAS
ncbi:MAG: hypothetical protein JJU29_18840 [Verrucomicrobia bacterium]|nr:hypothetical protein [Verrucomicrobiota bacterium]